jgi:hypothetical protein
VIVFSPNIVLSPSDPSPLDLNAPVIGYQTLVTSTNVAASEASAAGFPVSNLGNVSTASIWRSANADLQYVTVTLNGEYEVDYLAIARHNFSSGEIPIAVEIQAEPLGAWSTLIPDQFLDSNSARIFRFARGFPIAIRLKMFAGAAAPELAILYVGKLLVMQRRLYVGHSPITLSRRVQVVSGQSESGNYLGRIVTGSSLSTSASFSHLTPGWYRQNFEPFAKASETVPFFWAWRPQQYPREAGFAWRTGDITPSNQLANGMMQVEFEMAGVES